MTSHQFHPETSDTSGPTIADNCPRCAEQATNPLALDQPRLTTLWAKTLRWMRDDYYPKSNAERKAMRTIETAILLCSRMGLNPAKGTDVPIRTSPA